MIKNCVVTDFFDGILLHSSSNNNTLTNNTANSNSNYGILLRSSSNNNTLTNNTANSNNDGILLLYSSNNNLIFNIVCNNSNMDIYDTDNSNTGNNNTCGTPDGWDDAGTTGCTYSCTCGTACTKDKCIDSKCINYKIEGNSICSAALAMNAIRRSMTL